MTETSQPRGIPSVVSLTTNGHRRPASRLSTWLLANQVAPAGPEAGEKNQTHAWWKVMTLTGFDYFSTL